MKLTTFTNTFGSLALEVALVCFVLFIVALALRAFLPPEPKPKVVCVYTLLDGSTRTEEGEGTVTFITKDQTMPSWHMRPDGTVEFLFLRCEIRAKEGGAK